jgi:Zinc finger, C3HC4 type (RING finger)/CDK-activating kinase assembly factor MAT1
MQNGHISNEADGEALKHDFALLSLGRDSDANGMTDEDICPVCKNSTYLQKNLRFKINTKCYHRICEGCVDRITSTQKKCPIAGCPFAARGIIPRRGDYRVQTFGDLAIEREVDIRKRVMAMYVKDHSILFPYANSAVSTATRKNSTQNGLGTTSSSRGRK